MQYGYFFFISFPYVLKCKDMAEKNTVTSYLSRDAKIRLGCDMIRNKYFPEEKSTVTAVVLILSVTNSTFS